MAYSEKARIIRLCTATKQVGNRAASMLCGTMDVIFAARMAAEHAGLSISGGRGHNREATLATSLAGAWHTRGPIGPAVDSAAGRTSLSGCVRFQLAPIGDSGSAGASDANIRGADIPQSDASIEIGVNRHSVAITVASYVVAQWCMAALLPFDEIGIISTSQGYFVLRFSFVDTLCFFT